MRRGKNPFISLRRAARTKCARAVTKKSEPYLRLSGDGGQHSSLLEDVIKEEGKGCEMDVSTLPDGNQRKVAGAGLAAAAKTKTNPKRNNFDIPLWVFCHSDNGGCCSDGGSEDCCDDQWSAAGGSTRTNTTRSNSSNGSSSRRRSASGSSQLRRQQQQQQQGDKDEVRHSQTVGGHSSSSVVVVVGPSRRVDNTPA